VLENGVLREDFGYHKGELTGDWRRLHGEKLHDYLGAFCYVIERYNLL
jgi:hypothetical protein